MLGKFKFIFHICAMKETLDFFITHQLPSEVVYT